MKADEIKKLRSTMGVTQKVMAATLGIGVRYYQGLEAGDYEMKPGTLSILIKKIASEVN